MPSIQGRDSDFPCIYMLQEREREDALNIRSIDLWRNCKINIPLQIVGSYYIP